METRTFIKEFLERMQPKVDAISEDIKKKDLNRSSPKSLIYDTGILEGSHLVWGAVIKELTAMSEKYLGIKVIKSKGDKT